MRQNVVLTVASLLSVLFMTLHLADDIVRGMEPGTVFDLIVLPILAVQLYGTLVLAGKRSGYVIVLLTSLLELVVPVVHMKGAGVGGAIAASNGAFFFIWTLLALGLTALFSVFLSACELWEIRPECAEGRLRPPQPALDRLSYFLLSTLYSLALSCPTRCRRRRCWPSSWPRGPSCRPWSRSRTRRGGSAPHRVHHARRSEPPDGSCRSRPS